MWLRIAEASRATGLRRILAISWITGRLPTMSAYQVASQPDKFGWSRDLKLALVDHHPPSREKNAFSANVASNRGFTVRYFDDEAAAVAWLLEK